MSSIKKPDVTPEVYEQYDRIAQWFDQSRTKDLMEREYLEHVLKYLPNNGTILDLGCGIGEPIAQYFIQKGFHITGIDASINMLTMAKKRFPEMTWMHSDMRLIDLNEKFDALIAWDSFFHLNHNDQRAMFTTFEAHLKSSGILLFTSGPKEDVVWSKMDGHDFFHASLSQEEYESLLTKHHFKVLLHRVEDPNCGDHTVWVAQYTNDT